MRRLFFNLCYSQHGGSGLALGFRDVQEMPMADILEWTRLLDDRRTEEAKAIKRKK